MYRVRGEGGPEVQWVRQCLLLLCRPSGDQRHQYPTMNNSSFLKKKHWPTHKSACAPCKTLKSEVRKSRETEAKNKGFLQELGNYLVAGRDLPPASLVLDEEVSVLGPAEQVQHREILLENLFYAGVTHVPWLLLPCPWLQMQVKKTDPRMNLQNAFFF